ncbi:MAG: ABC transporter ATP-binding protein [Phycisphaerales bacterium]|nr:ABC transporter ATP-binding protein [Phycisphaerales bacterium]
MGITAEPPSADSPLAVVEQLRVEFGPIVAVRDVSLTLHAGDLVGLIGPNGAGKTTLLRAMAGLQAPTAGRTAIMGMDVLGRDRTVRRHVGFAPDSPPVYADLTVYDFLMFIGYCYDLDATTATERIDFWLEQLWLTDKRSAKIATLSRGMRQRITIARTLVPNPNVILLDEPSAGLDPAGRIEFRKVLASLRDQGKALIVSSHILADLEEYCTHIAILEAGTFKQFGRAKEMHGRAAGRRKYQLKVAGGGERLGNVLGAINGVTDVAHLDGAWTFEYDEDPSRAAELLRDLIGRDVAVALFTPMDDSLEHVYMRAGVKQVD